MLDRLRAHLAEGGALEAGTGQALLAHADQTTGGAVLLRDQLGGTRAELVRALACLEAWKQDAERLAAWVIAHPGDHETVLGLHDRTVRDYST